MPGSNEPWWRRWAGARREAAAPPSVVGGRFVLRAVLGRGAVGTVYLADDRRAGQEVALKLMAPPESLSAAQRDDWSVGFARESLAAARLRHPDIAALLDAGVVPEGAWLALEYASGVELTRYTRPPHLLPEPLALRLAARIARALAHAHGAGIVHRDLKPSNLRVDLPRGRLKLTDFGIARLHDIAQTGTGVFLGTPVYMAPELLHGETATPAADTWALGVLLFELLAGRRPREAATLGELLRALASEPPAELGALRPDLPPAVVAAVAEALQPEPRQRPADLVTYAGRLDRLASAAFAAA